MGFVLKLEGRVPRLTQQPGSCRVEFVFEFSSGGTDTRARILGSSMLPSPDRLRARAPFRLSGGSAGTWWAYYTHSPGAQSFAFTCLLLVILLSEQFLFPECG